jgi:hypothetical protein
MTTASNDAIAWAIEVRGTCDLTRSARIADEIGQAFTYDKQACNADVIVAAAVKIAQLIVTGSQDEHLRMIAGFASLVAMFVTAAEAVQAQQAHLH